MLLDTQVIIWHMLDPGRLTSRAVRAISKGNHFYSHASAWELAIKCGSGKLQLFINGERASARAFLMRAIAELRLAPLPLEFEDLVAVETLPPHHNDPFDRLLIVQAKRGMAIVSSDAVFDKYGVERVW